MDDPKLDFEITPTGTLTILIECPICSHTHYHQARDLIKDAELICPCGAQMQIDNSDFVKIDEYVTQIIESTEEQYDKLPANKTLLSREGDNGNGF